MIDPRMTAALAPQARGQGVRSIAEALVKKSQRPRPMTVSQALTPSDVLGPGYDPGYEGDGYMQPIDPNDPYFREEMGDDLQRYLDMDEQQRLQFLNDPGNGFVAPPPEDVNAVSPEDLMSRFDDARAYQVAQAGGVASDAVEEVPSKEDLVQMGQAVGIPPEALQGLDLNATEARNFGFLLRMMEAEKTVRELEESNTLGQRLLELIPGRDIEAMLMNPDYRRYTLARENFNEAALRAATGATINQQEMPMQRQNYFPLPTDDDATRDLLRRQRQALMMSLTAGSGPAARIIPQYGQPVVPDDVPGVDFTTMSNDELLKALGQ